MQRIIDNDYLTLILRLVVGFAFIYASLYKIIDPDSFARSIYYYHIVPGSLINLMALILPWLELISGLCLILGVAYRGSVVLINAMVVMFIVALASSIYRGLNVECGCFKAAEEATSAAWESLWFDLLLLACTVQLLLSRSRRWMISPH